MQVKSEVLQIRIFRIRASFSYFTIKVLILILNVTQYVKSYFIKYFNGNNSNSQNMMKYYSEFPTSNTGIWMCTAV